MGQLKTKGEQGNVNVTLDPAKAAPQELAGMEFPCPICGAGLPILPSITKKPYCTCNQCGVQLFVRGKAGIRRLREMAAAGILVSSKEESASHGIQLHNRLEQLKLQKSDLNLKRGIFFRDENVENAIQIVDAEIEKVEGELARIASKTESGASK
jgi:DNA-directed RNA polymerase subunit RPC12/RpoP